MTISRDEALAGLKLLVCVVRADRRVLLEEYRAFQKAVRRIALPRGVTANSLLSGTYDPEELVLEIRTPKARTATYEACWAMAHVDDMFREPERGILAKLEKAWGMSQDEDDGLALDAAGSSQFPAVAAIDDPDARRREIDADVTKYSILAAAIGLIPVPSARVATDMAVVAVQRKVAHDIGRYWGHAMTPDGARRLVAGMGAATPARSAIDSLMALVSPLRISRRAVTNFSSTWAVGRTSDRYFADGCESDTTSLRQSFQRHRRNGKAAYERKKSEVRAKSEETAEELRRLGADLQAGRITRAACEQRVLALT